MDRFILFLLLSASGGNLCNAGSSAGVARLLGGVRHRRLQEACPDGCTKSNCCSVDGDFSCVWSKGSCILDDGGGGGSTDPPSKSPSRSPTAPPSASPSKAPSASPTTAKPTDAPTNSPSKSPTLKPTSSPLPAGMGYCSDGSGACASMAACSCGAQGAAAEKDSSAPPNLFGGRMLQQACPSGCAKSNCCELPCVAFKGGCIFETQAPTPNPTPNPTDAVR